jgi:hypothetical protein
VNRIRGWLRPRGESGGASTRFRIVVASLIAVTSLVGALSAWRAEAASMKGEEAERKGFADGVIDQQAQTTIRQDMQAAVFDYERARALSDAARQLRTQARGVPGDDRQRLLLQSRADQRAATAILGQVSRDALRPNGTLDLAHYFDVNYAQVRQSQDVDPKPEFEETDAQQTKSERLTGLTALLVAAAFFFTAAQVARRFHTRQLYVAGGAVVLLVSAVLLSLVELAT